MSYLDEDTRPTGTMPKVELDADGNLLPPPPRKRRGGQRLAGLVMLLIAAGFTFGTIFLLLVPPDTGTDAVPNQPESGEAALLPTNTLPAPTTTPTEPPTEAAEEAEAPGETVNINQPLDSQMADTLLQMPLESLEMAEAMQLDRGILDPFTIVPDRPRNEIITYEAVRGDTIDEIAERFNLEPETIAWSNDRRIIQVLRPGDQLFIPPVDGVYIQAIGSQRSIADYTEIYGLDDPYIVLDSEFNELVGFTPETIPPSGTRIFFPGGEAEEIVWRADIQVSDGGSGGGAGQSGGVPTVQFQANQPGDCGPVPISGGTFWTNPVPSGNYMISRGFSSWHTGIDLARAEGEPIAAANGGTVIFAGWNGFGYGNMVAIIHGPNMTVYGHMSSVSVGCNQTVEAGQIIGTMGSTGNSSGPHLHFEVRGGPSYTPINPSAVIGF